MEGLQEWPPCIPGPRPHPMLSRSRHSQTTRQKLIPEYHPRRDRELLQAWRWGSDRASASNMTYQAILYSSSIQNPGLIQGFAWQFWHPDMSVHNPFQH